jgi:integrase
MKKPTGRKPMRIGACLLKEVPYKGEYRVEITWRNPDRRKRWENNWRAAEDFARAEDRRLEIAKENPGNRHTFNDAADSYTKKCERRVLADDLSPDTWRTYRLNLKHVRPKFGPMLLPDVTATEVEDWLLEKAASAKHNTLDGYRRCVHAVLAHAVEIGWIAGNVLDVKKVKTPGKKTKRADIPDPSDMEVLRKYLDGPRPFKFCRLKWLALRVMVVLGGIDGMRAGEVAAIEWDSIDRDTGEIDVKKTRARLKGLKAPKADSYRKIPTTGRARQIIEEYAVAYKKETWQVCRSRSAVARFAVLASRDGLGLVSRDHAGRRLDDRRHKGRKAVHQAEVFLSRSTSLVCEPLA